MNLNGIQAITFDAAGTLIAPHPSVGEVYAEELAKLGYPLEPEHLDNRFRSAFKQFKHEQPEAVLDREGWRSIVTNTLSGLTPKHDIDRQFEALWKAFAEPNRWRLLPNVASTLKALHKQGIRLFVLSNNDARLRGVLDGLGVIQYFEAVFVSAEIGVEKPAPKIFEFVQQQISVSAENMLHVGDSPIEDIQGAQQAGWRAALVGPKAETESILPTLSRAASISELFRNAELH